MSELETAKKMKEYFDRKRESSGKNSCCIQFIKSQARILKKQILQNGCQCPECKEAVELLVAILQKSVQEKKE